MYGFQAKFLCYTSDTERERLIEIEEPQIDLEDLNDFGYENFDQYAWCVATCKALKMANDDEALVSMTFLYN